MLLLHQRRNPCSVPLPHASKLRRCHRPSIHMLRPCRRLQRHFRTLRTLVFYCSASCPCCSRSLRRVVATVPPAAVGATRQRIVTRHCPTATSLEPPTSPIAAASPLPCCCYTHRRLHIVGVRHRDVTRASTPSLSRRTSLSFSVPRRVDLFSIHNPKVKESSNFYMLPLSTFNFKLTAAIIFPIFKCACETQIN
jgi:hypothetical protein